MLTALVIKDDITCGDTNLGLLRCPSYIHAYGISIFSHEIHIKTLQAQTSLSRARNNDLMTATL
jgi:hypothetical protein